jgi:hypothetical protein
VRTARGRADRDPPPMKLGGASRLARSSFVGSARVAGPMGWQEGGPGVSWDDVVGLPRVIGSGALPADPACGRSLADLLGSAAVVLASVELALRVGPGWCWWSAGGAAAAVGGLPASKAGLHRVSGGPMTLVVLSGLGCMAWTIRWAMASRSSGSRS